MRLGCAQYGGGVVSMGDGEVTFKGGTITNTKAAVRTGNDARSIAGTGCRLLQRLRLAVCGARCMGMRGSFARSSYVVSAAGRMPHLGSKGPGSGRHVACRGTLCCIAWYGALLPTVRCLAHRFVARPGSGCSSGVAVGTQTGVRGSGFPTIGG
jgi:hypothetical protein